MSDELETDYENITETYKVECPSLWQITIVSEHNEDNYFFVVYIFETTVFKTFYVLK